QKLAGFAEPQPAWRVIGASRFVSRFEALRAGETPLVGREQELELLLARWGKARSGDGQVVLLSGAPGGGQSRLPVALRERLVAEPHGWRRYFCSPHYQDSALFPFAGQLEQAAGFKSGDSPDERLDKLEALLDARDRPEDPALLSELLLLPGAAR